MLAVSVGPEASNFGSSSAKSTSPSVASFPPGGAVHRARRMRQDARPSPRCSTSSSRRGRITSSPSKTLLSRLSWRRSHRDERHVGRTDRSRAACGRLREDPTSSPSPSCGGPKTMSLAMVAAETGHLVMGTLHTGRPARPSATSSASPGGRTGAGPGTLSESLRAVVSQRLVRGTTAPPRRRAQGAHRDTAVTNSIREEKIQVVPSCRPESPGHGHSRLPVGR